MGTAPVTRKLTNIETNHKCRIDVVNKKSRSIDRFAVISGKAESFTGNIVLFGNLSHDAEISNSSSKCSNTLPMICIEKGGILVVEHFSIYVYFSAITKTLAYSCELESEIEFCSAMTLEIVHKQEIIMTSARQKRSLQMRKLQGEEGKQFNEIMEKVYDKFIKGKA